MAKRTWLVDLDGVVWLAGQPIPGSSAAIKQLRGLGDRVVFFTNNSYPAHEDIVGMLDAVDVEARPEDLLSSAQAAARLCDPGTRALVLGGRGIYEALVSRGVVVERAEDDPTGEFDAVVSGIDIQFDYRRLAAALRAVRGGARLIGTNNDRTYPTKEGLLPGAGSLLAALAFSSGVEPTIAGKPYGPAADLIAEEIGEISIVVGDSPATDGALATRLGTRFGLVLSGVTHADHDALDPPPDHEAPDLAQLVSSVLAES